MVTSSLLRSLKNVVLTPLAVLATHGLVAQIPNFQLAAGTTEATVNQPYVHLGVELPVKDALFLRMTLSYAREHKESRIFNRVLKPPEENLGQYATQSVDASIDSLLIYMEPDKGIRDFDIHHNYTLTAGIGFNIPLSTKLSLTPSLNFGYWLTSYQEVDVAGSIAWRYVDSSNTKISRLLVMQRAVHGRFVGNLTVPAWLSLTPTCSIGVGFSGQLS